MPTPTPSPSKAGTSFGLHGLVLNPLNPINHQRINPSHPQTSRHFPSRTGVRSTKPVPLRAPCSNFASETSVETTSTEGVPTWSTPIGVRHPSPSKLWRWRHGRRSWARLATTYASWDPVPALEPSLIDRQPGGFGAFFFFILYFVLVLLLPFPQYPSLGYFLSSIPVNSCPSILNKEQLSLSGSRDLFLSFHLYLAYLSSSWTVYSSICLPYQLLPPLSSEIKSRIKSSPYARRYSITTPSHNTSPVRYT